MIIKGLFLGFILIMVAFACESTLANAIRNAGLTSIAADLLAGSFVTYAIFRLAKQ